MNEYDQVQGKNIHLIDVDSRLPNIALMKISTHYKRQGYIVTFSKGARAPIPCDPDPDICYASIVFRKNAHVLDNFSWNYPDTELIVGGSGYNLQSRLPPEIECCSPDYSLYPDCDSSYGFASRGCIRRCGFCVVPEKEGRWHHDQHPEIWHNPVFSKITFLDNNILVDVDWFFEVTQWCMERNLSIWFCQGLDIRLLTKEVVVRLREMKKHKLVTFAWDNIDDEGIILEKLALLKTVFSSTDLRAHVMFYVYCDGDHEYDSAVYRCRKLKELGCNCFVMLNMENKRTQRMKDLQRWSARKWIYWKIDIDQYRKPEPREVNFVTQDIDLWI